jgi:hypothetical protein
MELWVFLETDCPTCQLAVPYLNRLHRAGAVVRGFSQDPETETENFVSNMSVEFPLAVDAGWVHSRELDPSHVPAWFLMEEGAVRRAEIGFAKAALNEIAAALGVAPVALEHDGNPAWKPGCESRHREPESAGPAAPALFWGERGRAASRLEAGADPVEQCFALFGDALPVVPPTEERVARFLGATELDPHQIIGRIPPCYGEATVEKIAANAVMAGCRPEQMRVLIPLVRAVCDERFNAHGWQATTHFAAPLVMVNGPVRHELGYHCGQNLFSNVARANSTTGRALQLLLTNVGGARPTEIDMSALGNPAKFSYVMAENEEASPWEPLHVALGFRAAQSTLTLFAGEPPRGVAEHNARTARGVLRAISRALATVWNYRMCSLFEAVIVIGPEHAHTIARDGFSRADAVAWLFENTGIPVREFEEEPDGDGLPLLRLYERVTIRGEECYRKFARPDQLTLVVAGGGAGKFSAVIGSWATGPQGSQRVTYPVE